MLTSTSSMDILRRGLRRGVQQLTRDRSWGATLVLLSAVMVLVQLFLVFLLGVNGVGNMLTSRAGIQLEILPTASEQGIQELYAALKSHPSVENASYVTSEQAYEQYKANDPELISFLDEYGLQNPFPDTISVTLTSLDAYDAFAQDMQASEWATVINPSFVTAADGREREMRSLLQVTSGLRTLSIIFIVTAIVVLFFTVLEWVSRTAMRRGQELMLEHLLGAPSLSVVLPFVSEMTILLVGGVIIGTAIVGAFLLLLPFFMPALALEAPFRLLQQQVNPLLLSLFPILLLIEIIAMPLLAFGGTVWGVRKRLPSSFTFLS
jgi:cell division transport system permease protein